MKAIVLLSGGLDSTTCLAYAKKHYEDVIAVNIKYGQKHEKETTCARSVAKHYGVRLYEFNLTDIMQYSDSALLQNSTNAIKQQTYKQQVDTDGVVNTYVPFRNGLILSVVATLAQSIYPKDKTDIIIGTHADDYTKNAYADCSEGFTYYMTKAINEGTYDYVDIKAPLLRLNKSQVVSLGLKLKAPYELTWSCYEGKDKPCGKCATCKDREIAFKTNNTVDPIL